MEAGAGFSEFTNSDNTQKWNGGAGGGYEGTNGYGWYGEISDQRAEQYAAGTGTYNTLPTDGKLGRGGSCPYWNHYGDASNQSNSWNTASSGAGGGLYGGAGGNLTNGPTGSGGGSSYIGGVNHASTTAGVREGHGKARITFIGTDELVLPEGRVAIQDGVVKDTSIITSINGTTRYRGAEVSNNYPTNYHYLIGSCIANPGDTQNITATQTVTFASNLVGKQCKIKYMVTVTARYGNNDAYLKIGNTKIRSNNINNGEVFTDTFTITNTTMTLYAHYDCTSSGWNPHVWVGINSLIILD